MNNSGTAEDIVTIQSASDRTKRDLQVLNTLLSENVNRYLLTERRMRISH